MQQTKRQVGNIIQQAIEVAKIYHQKLNGNNESEYNRLFTTIYHTFYPKVYGLVKVKLRPHGSPGDAEEISDDILMEIWKSLHQFK